jgi:hypothetical protein
LYGLPLLAAALSSFANSSFPLHASFLALGDIPSSLPELSEDAAIGHLLSKTPQQIVLGLSGFELHAHLFGLTTSLPNSCRIGGDQHLAIKTIGRNKEKSRLLSYPNTAGTATEIDHSTNYPLHWRDYLVIRTCEASPYE